jgi:glycosyltransferase involved in cell wall biosynthesis
MNICYLVSYFSTQAGTESSVYHMSMAMAELGHNVHIVSLTGRGQWDFTSFADRIAVHQFDLQDDIIRRFRRAEDFFPVSAWRYGRSIKRILPAIVNDHGIDIIEATDWGMDALAYLPTRQIPVCVRLHGYPGFKVDFDNHILRKWPKSYINWLFQRKHILGADLVTGVSESYANFVRQAWEIKEKEIMIIPIAVNLNIFHPTDASREDHSILFAGRLEKLKGMEILEQAISMVLKQMPRTKFHFAGVDHNYDNHRQTWSQRLIEMYGHDNIAYLGSLSTKELVRYYQQSAICVVPSLYEPGATVALEAMACGCPVLATRVGGLADIIKDRKTGLLSPPGDSAALAEGLIELLRNRQLRQDLSQKALESIRQNFEINKIRQKTLTAYSNAIDQFRCLVNRQ